MKKYHLTLDTVALALSYLDYNDRKEWYEMAFAIRSEFGADGFDVWDSWGSQYAKYNKAEAKQQWRSAKPGGGISIGTLIHRAQSLGFAFNDNDCVEISQDEIDARKAKREADEKQYAAEIKHIQGEVAKLANLVWENSLPAHEWSYTDKKGIKPVGARIGLFPFYKLPEFGEAIQPFRSEQALIIPILNEQGKIVSLQAYFDGEISLGEGYTTDRAYMKGGQKQGCYSLIGTPRDTIVDAEGYATGCSIYESTGWAVMIAFDSGNLPAVAKLTRKLFPHVEIIIAGDNDPDNPQTGKPGAGITAANDAGNAVNGRVLFPDTVGMDWNDVHQRDGLEAVQSAFMAHKMPALVPANDNAPVDIDFYTPFPVVSKNGKPKSTIQNLEEVLHRLNVTVRYNVIKKEDEILIPGESFTVDNRANASLARLISRCNEFDMPTGNIGEFITYIADKNAFNPVATWVTSKPWDGVSRLNDFFNTITPNEPKFLPDGTTLHHALMRRWMLSAVAAAFEPNGVAAGGVLVLQGDQNLGKTKWFKSLAPEELDILQDGLQLRPDDRDSVKQAVSYWLVELGELDATFKKSDIAALKAFLTRKNDVMRRAYARLESDYARRTVFFGSVNPREFLHDPTGNRRYWTIECASINHTHGMDMQQIWAEVYELYKQHESWYLNNDEMLALNNSNTDFQVTDPIHERILSKLDWESPVMDWRWTTATELLIEIGIDRPTTGELRSAGELIRKQNGNQKRKSNGRVLMLVPPKLRFMGNDTDRPF